MDREKAKLIDALRFNGKYIPRDRKTPVTKSDLHEAIEHLRESVRSLGEALKDIPEPDSPWYPLKDPEFWDTMDRIEQVGQKGDNASAAFLVDLVLIDNLGPMARSLFLSQAALIAVSQIQTAVQKEIVRRSAMLFEGASSFKKIGMLKLIDASNLELIIEPHKMMLSDDDKNIRIRAQALYDAILNV